MKSKSIIFASAALAIAIASPLAGATETCQHNLQVASVSGQTLTIVGTEPQTYTIDTTTENLEGWGKGNELRLCGDQITNISFQTLPTYTATPVIAEQQVTQPSVEQASTADSVAGGLEAVAEQVTESVLQEAQPDKTAK